MLASHRLGVKNTSLFGIILVAAPKRAALACRRNERHHREVSVAEAFDSVKGSILDAGSSSQQPFKSRPGFIGVRAGF